MTPTFGEIVAGVPSARTKRDVMTPPRASQSLQEQIPGARSVVIDFSGHSLMAEAPDATLDALIEFLK